MTHREVQQRARNHPPAAPHPHPIRVQMRRKRLGVKLLTCRLWRRGRALGGAQAASERAMRCRGHNNSPKLQLVTGLRVIRQNNWRMGSIRHCQCAELLSPDLQCRVPRPLGPSGGVLGATYRESIVPGTHQPGPKRPNSPCSAVVRNWKQQPPIQYTSRVDQW